MLLLEIHRRRRAAAPAPRGGRGGREETKGPERGVDEERPPSPAGAVLGGIRPVAAASLIAQVRREGGSSWRGLLPASSQHCSLLQPLGPYLPSPPASPPYPYHVFALILFSEQVPMDERLSLLAAMASRDRARVQEVR